MMRTATGSATATSSEASATLATPPSQAIATDEDASGDGMQVVNLDEIVTTKKCEELIEQLGKKMTKHLEGVIKKEFVKVMATLQTNKMLGASSSSSGTTTTNILLHTAASKGAGTDVESEIPSLDSLSQLIRTKEELDALEDALRKPEVASRYVSRAFISG